MRVNMRFFTIVTKRGMTIDDALKHDLRSAISDRGAPRHISTADAAVHDFFLHFTRPTRRASLKHGIQDSQMFGRTTTAKVMNGAYCCGRTAVNLDGTLSQLQGASGLVSNPASHLPEAGLVMHVAIVLSHA